MTIFHLSLREPNFLLSWHLLSINKAQGQSFERIGLWLPGDVFAHGQLFVQLSRVRSKEILTVLWETKKVHNIVYPEVLWFKEGEEYKENWYDDSNKGETNVKVVWCPHQLKSNRIVVIESKPRLAYYYDKTNLTKSNRLFEPIWEITDRTFLIKKTHDEGKTFETIISKNKNNKTILKTYSLRQGFSNILVSHPPL